MMSFAIARSPSLLFSSTLGTDVTQDQLQACARLFSQNYGVWGPKASKVNEYLKHGARVKMTPSKLKSHWCLGVPGCTILATCHAEEELVPHAFATTWDVGLGKIGWVTQLVVRQDYRQQGIATFLLGRLKQSQHTAFGLASSHPAACKALVKLAHTNIQDVDLEFIKGNADAILQSTSIDYLKTAQLRGSLFEQNPVDATAVSSAFTEFYVDHDEPLDALKRCKGNWPLGSLIEGHEFFLVLKL
ncbi:hypothetical protein OF83DRAFT_1072201 [Amylostereum chailletii]|nr:hypothetical protein OF83DRAFT_1072201 [Amylostereum chailletii]